MIRFSKIFFYITVAVLLVWQLPWCYAFLTLKPVKTPFTMYSSVLGHSDHTSAKFVHINTMVSALTLYMPYVGG